MLSRFILSVAVVLLVSAGAYAQIGAGSIYQHQNYVIGDLLGFDGSGLSSVLNVSHGYEAESIQSLEVDNQQAAPTSFKPPWCTPVCPSGCDTKANQWQLVDIKQKTEAESDCGIIAVSAFLNGFGEQDQTIGSSDDLKTQTQTLGLAADQLLISNGNAEGEAINDVDDMSQAQVGLNVAGSMGEYSLIDAFQMAEVEGTPNTTLSVVNSMIATTYQNQKVF